MSSAAVSVALTRGLRFYQTTIGKKAIMAVTGLLLFGYLIGHLAGNLQVFAGSPDKINQYAHFLHTNTGLLWGARVVLLTAVILHIVASVQLALLAREARPVGYVKKTDVPASYAARTMMWSGPIIAAFVVFHVLHLTTGDIVPLHRTATGDMDVYRNLVQGFQNPAISISYIVAMLLLAPHLFHGVWSMFQSLGVSHPRYTPMLKRIAAIFAIAIAGGNISIPLAVMAGLVS
jgi:succinate dehydrogenase / fumarate reductase cytochrome b subunit